MRTRPPEQNAIFETATQSTQATTTGIDRRRFLEAVGVAALAAPLACATGKGAAGGGAGSGGSGPSADVPAERRGGMAAPDVEALLAQMTLDEKIGQMSQIDHHTIIKNDKVIGDYFLGSVLSG